MGAQLIHIAGIIGEAAIVLEQRLYAFRAMPLDVLPDEFDPQSERVLNLLDALHERAIEPPILFYRCYSELSGVHTFGFLESLNVRPEVAFVQRGPVLLWYLPAQCALQFLQEPTLPSIDDTDQAVHDEYQARRWLMAGISDCELVLRGEGETRILIAASSCGRAYSYRDARASTHNVPDWINDLQ